MSDHLPPMPTCHYCGTPVEECEEGHEMACIGNQYSTQSTSGASPHDFDQARYENEYKTGDPGDGALTLENILWARDMLRSKKQAPVFYPVPISLTRYLATLLALLLAVAALGYILGGM